MSTDTRAQLYCLKGGDHAGEKIAFINLNQLHNSDPLMCIICKNNLPKTGKYQTILLKTFFDDLNWKLKTMQKRSESSIAENITDNETAAIQAFQSFRNYINIKMQKLQQKLHNYFRDVQLQAKFNLSLRQEDQRFDINHIKRQTNTEAVSDWVSSALRNVKIKDSQIIDINQSHFILETDQSYKAFTINIINSLKKMHKAISKQYRQIPFPDSMQSVMNNTHVSSFYQTGGNFTNSMSGRPMSAANSVRDYQTSKSNGTQQSFYSTSNNFLPLNMQPNANNSISDYSAYRKNSASPNLRQNSIGSGSQHQLNTNPVQHVSFDRDVEINNFTDQSVQGKSMSNSQNGRYTGYPPQVSLSSAKEKEKDFVSVPNILNANINLPQQFAFCGSPFQNPSSIYNQSSSQRFSGNSTGKSGTTTDKLFDLNASSHTVPANIAAVSSGQTLGRNGKSNAFPLHSNNHHQPAQSLDQDIRLKKQEITFKWSYDMKHTGVDIISQSRIAKAKNDHFQNRLVLTERSVENKPMMQVRWAFMVRSCQNMAYSCPLALGLCFKNIVEANQFQFLGEDTNFKEGTSKDQNQASPQHGCYLLTSSGFIRNTNNPEEDMKRVNVRFNQGDIITCFFNPFKKFIEFSNQKSGESCTIHINFRPGDRLYPCARISYSSDVVQIMEV